MDDERAVENAAREKAACGRGSDDASSDPVSQSSSKRSHSPEHSPRPEQVVGADLQPHLAAAEERVSKSLQQIIESVETRLLGALRQAAVSIVDNLSKDAASCLFLSERKVAMLGHELSCTKQQAVSMLMRLKQATDAQIADAARQILFERGRAQEAEAKLSSAQESNRRLRLELKRKGQVLEALQRCYPKAAPQGLPLGSSGGSEGKRGERRLKGSPGQWHPQQMPSILSPGATAISESVNGFPGAQMGTLGAQPVGSGLTPVTDGATRNHIGLPTIDCAHPGRSDLRAAVDVSPIFDCPTPKSAYGQHGPPTRDFVSVRCAEGISPPAHQVYSLSDHQHVDPLEEKEAVAVRQKSDPEFRSLKDSDEEKSSLTIDALYCKDEGIPVQPLEEYQSDVKHGRVELQETDTLKFRNSSDYKGDHETNVPVKVNRGCEMPAEILSSSTTNDGDGLDHGPAKQIPSVAKDIAKAQEMGRALNKVSSEYDSSTHPPESSTPTEKTLVETVTVSSTVTSPNKKAPFADSPVIKPTADNIPGEQASTPEPKSGSFGGQVLRRKRNQGSSKLDGNASGKKSKILHEGDALGALDSSINSRDTRRLMQGARQLFSLAESKWS